MTKTVSVSYAVATLALLAGVLFATASFVSAQGPGMPPPPPPGMGLPPAMNDDHAHDNEGNHIAAESAGTLTTVEQVEKISLLEKLIELLKTMLGMQTGSGSVVADNATTKNTNPPPMGQGPQGNGPPRGGVPGGTSFEGGDANELSQFSFPDSDYYGDYSISDDDHGTEVSVTIAGDVRTMTANALPNHDTGAFPNDGNPNTITAQDLTYTFTTEPEYTGEAQWVRELGVAINGVKFEPETGEFVQCDSGEQYKYEAVQDEVNLGLDFNNAHVQPTGAYHYHGVSELLTDLYDNGDDLIHVGFANDGHYILYDNTGTLESSYQIADGQHEGTGCSYRGADVDMDGTNFDGTFVSDWEYVPGSGDLDACNGAFVDDTYVYFVSDDYPYAGRCVQGEM